MGVKTNRTKKTVFVGMSGGVDSSVAAYLLKKQGYNVVGIFMRCFNVDGCAERDAEDARRVAERIGIPFYALDLEEEYKKRVVEYMVEGYRQGITPNPDVMCNKEIKFGLFLDRALALGADYVATGHYVRSGNRVSGMPYSLLQARDANKDQSYFLWTLTQQQLAHSLFPIGGYLKSEVRDIARKAVLPTAEKKDSQGICFIGKVGLTDFLRSYIPQRKGAVVAPDGRQVGEHAGAEFYTVGQRHLGGNIQYPASGIQGRRDKRPIYVASKNIKENTLTVVQGDDDPLLYKNELTLADVNFQGPGTRERGAGENRVFARVRYRQKLTPATLQKRGKRWMLIFDQPQKFVAEGQSAVWYSRKGELLGGGIISSASCILGAY